MERTKCNKQWHSANNHYQRLFRRISMYDVNWERPRSEGLHCWWHAGSSPYSGNYKASYLTIVLPRYLIGYYHLYSRYIHLYCKPTVGTFVVHLVPMFLSPMYQFVAYLCSFFSLLLAINVPNLPRYSTYNRTNYGYMFSVLLMYRLYKVYFGHLVLYSTKFTVVSNQRIKPKLEYIYIYALTVMWDVD